MALSFGWAWILAGLSRGSDGGTAGRRSTGPALQQLDAHLLRDIGLCRSQVGGMPATIRIEGIRGPRHE